MFICHACGNCTLPREQRTTLPVYRTVPKVVTYRGDLGQLVTRTPTGETQRQITREIVLCPRCAKTIFHGNPDARTVFHRLNTIIAQRSRFDADVEEVEREHRQQREAAQRGRDRLYVERQRAQKGQPLAPAEEEPTEQPIPTPEPVKPRGSFQVPQQARQPTLYEMLKRRQRPTGDKKI